MSKTNIETVAPGAPGEKTGNTSWTQCPNCKGWFHVGPEILKRPAIDLHCPHCAKDFAQGDALRIIKAS